MIAEIIRFCRNMRNSDRDLGWSLVRSEGGKNATKPQTGRPQCNCNIWLPGLLKYFTSPHLAAKVDHGTLKFLYVFFGNIVLTWTKTSVAYIYRPLGKAKQMLTLTFANVNQDKPIWGLFLGEKKTKLDQGTLGMSDPLQLTFDQWGTDRTS